MFINFLSTLSTFYQVFYQLYQLFINILSTLSTFDQFFLSFFINYLSTLSSFDQHFINFINFFLSTKLVSQYLEVHSLVEEAPGIADLL